MSFTCPTNQQYDELRWRIGHLAATCAAIDAEAKALHKWGTEQDAYRFDQRERRAKAERLVLAAPGFAALLDPEKDVWTLRGKENAFVGEAEALRAIVGVCYSLSSRMA